jgi:methyl-accepting chemotaxis protein
MSGNTGEISGIYTVTRSPRRKRSLRSKVLALTVGSAALVAGVLIGAFYFQTREAMTGELRTRAQTAAIGLANNLAFTIFSGDRGGASSAVRSTLADLPDVAYVAVLGGRGEVLAGAVHPQLEETGASLADVPRLGPSPGVRTADRLDDLKGTPVLAVEAPCFIEQVGKGHQDEEAAMISSLVDPLSAPAGGERRQVGLVQIGFRLESLQSRMSVITTRAMVLGFLVIVGCAAVAFLLARVVTEPVERLTQAAGGIARGNLQQKVAASGGDDEIAELARSFESMTSALRTMISDLRSASLDVENEASRILATSTRQVGLASQQASAINQTRQTANEIARASQEATRYADSVILTAQKSEDLSVEGQKVVQESVAGMERLGGQVEAIVTSIESLATRTQKIGEIIGTVKEVAEMSHVLSLNLSIQAAHAGANRRGFDVVATEMRKLAALSGVAASEVRQIVLEIQKYTQEALQTAREGTRSAADTVWLAQMAGKTIIGLAEVIRQSSRKAREIADHARNQTVGIEQILSAINDQARAMDEAVLGSRQVEDVAGNLSMLSKRLSGMVSRYRG